MAKYLGEVNYFKYDIRLGDVTPNSIELFFDDFLVPWWGVVLLIPQMILFWHLEAGEILQLAQNTGTGIHN